MGARTGRAQRVAQRLYKRFGPRIMLGCVAAGFLSALGTIAVSILFLVRYFGLRRSNGAYLVELFVPIGCASGLLGVLAIRRHLSTILSWRRGAAPTDVWHALVRAPSAISRTIAVGAVAGVIAIPWFILHYDLPWYAALPVSTIFVITVAATWTVSVAATELSLRPMLEDVAAELPPDFTPPPYRLNLRTRALLAPPIVTLYAALLVGAYANESNNGTVRATIATGLALATIAVATVIFIAVNRTVLAPIDDLIAATKRVRDGDISTPVPLVTGDELGELTADFNQMLTELRHRGEELVASRQRVVSAADAARKRIERDLHDGAQQHLVLLGLKLSVAERLLTTDPSAARAAIGELKEDLDRALAELRDLAHGIYPQVLESEGLPGALAEAAKRAAIPTQLHLDGVRRYTPDIEAAVYFCCLEALQNAAKHAGNNARATVTLTADDTSLSFEISDDGVGFDPDSTRISAGVQNMTDRIGALGGTLEITSSPGHGTTIAGELPSR